MGHCIEYLEQNTPLALILKIAAGAVLGWSLAFCLELLLLPIVTELMQ